MARVDLTKRAVHANTEEALAAAPRAGSMTLGKLSLPALGALLVLGVASGLPFDLNSATLQSWLADAAPKLDLKDIGLFSLVGLPYVLKPLWSPLLDRFEPPLIGHLGRRRGWILIAQVGCALTIFGMALTPPESAPVAIGVLALTLAFFSASQDIVVDAWRTDVLPAASRGLGAALASWGYRLGMLLAGFLTPILAVRAGLGWEAAYACMGVIMLIGPVATLVAPREPTDIAPPKTLAEAVYLPFKDLIERPGRTRRTTLVFLGLVVTYKLGDAFGSSLFTVFLQRGLGFAPDEVAAFRKTIGVAAVLGGMIIGGLLMVRMRLGTALLVFGILQALTNLVFVGLATTHRDFGFLAVAIVGENVATGLGAVAFVTFLTALCDRRFSATQYALLAALATLGRVIVGPIAGPTAESLGWSGYFLISTAAAIPGLILVVVALPHVRKLDA